jgi:hypothetical protein
VGSATSIETAPFFSFFLFLFFAMVEEVLRELRDGETARMVKNKTLAFISE